MHLEVKFTQKIDAYSSRIIASHVLSARLNEMMHLKCNPFSGGKDQGLDTTSGSGSAAASSGAGFCADGGCCA